MMSTSIVLGLVCNFPVTTRLSDLNFFGQITWTRITVKMLHTRVERELSDIVSEVH